MSEVCASIERFYSVPFAVEVELTRLPMDLEGVLKLQEGDVLQTRQQIGAPLRVYAGGVELARADLVTLDGKIAARIAQISPKRT